MCECKPQPSGDCYHLWRKAPSGKCYWLWERCFRSRSAAIKAQMLGRVMALNRQSEPYEVKFPKGAKGSMVKKCTPHDCPCTTWSLGCSGDYLNDPFAG